MKSSNEKLKRKLNAQMKSSNYLSQMGSWFQQIEQVFNKNYKTYKLGDKKAKKSERHADV